MSGTRRSSCKTHGCACRRRSGRCARFDASRSGDYRDCRDALLNLSLSRAQTLKRLQPRGSSQVSPKAPQGPFIVHGLIVACPRIESVARAL